MVSHSFYNTYILYAILELTSEKNEKTSSSRFGKTFINNKLTNNHNNMMINISDNSI